jgi:NADH:ubiquinone oxidoreductase subunit C
LQPADSPQNAGINNGDQKAAPAPPPPASPPAVTGSSSVPKAPIPSPPDTSRTKALADKILGMFPSTNVDYVRERRVKVTVAPDQIKAVALFVRDVLGFDHLNVVGGTDYMQAQEFEVIYFVGSISEPGQQDLVVQLAERVKRDDPKVPSLTEVWSGAEYHERETFEMLGIVFEGHPDLRRLLLPEDWNDIPPLRKDYISPGR